MNVLSVLFALFWFGWFIALCLGVEPDKVIIGCAMLISAVNFLKEVE
ncbi:hypothetical protein SAMN05216389_11120 [Oceanobacillus limi]|uniref:Uncharacterized protein n=1 Tax=Oceanobacillus limi TaxID=930131 RepID=A0A1I0EB54_9BACI|nr:hypothetical protein [Oceanobacillus limi]SET42394.1 hypothetical protein SAMN05216389_11120 [Oceanobacillus limi]